MRWHFIVASIAFANLLGNSAAFAQKSIFERPLSETIGDGSQGPILFPRPSESTSETQQVRAPSINPDTGEVYAGSGSGGERGQVVAKATLYLSTANLWCWKSDFKNIYGRPTAVVASKRIQDQKMRGGQQIALAKDKIRYPLTISNEAPYGVDFAVDGVGKLSRPLRIEPNKSQTYDFIVAKDFAPYARVRQPDGSFHNYILDNDVHSYRFVRTSSNKVIIVFD